MITGIILKVAKIAKSITITETILRKFLLSEFAKNNLSPNLLVLLRDVVAGTERKMDEKIVLHRFWKQDSPILNKAEGYINPNYKSEFLYSFLPKLEHSLPIIELGCNVGRNLNYLFTKGFYNLSGVEINEHAVKLMEETYPEFYRQATIYNDSIEVTIKKIPEKSFELVFTMAVLEHIHPSSEFIFNEMIRISKKYIITVEDEVNDSHRHKARNYKKIFENLGTKEIKSSNQLPKNRAFVARLFRVK